MKNLLFVTWDGPQTNYLQSLFLPIFQGLKGKGWQVHVLQFTWAAGDEVERRRAACAAAGIPYAHVGVLRRPKGVGAMLALLAGMRRARALLKQEAFDAVMPRSTLPALVALLASRGLRLEIVFDADGLPIDERVEFAALDPSSFTHRILRHVESRAIVRASVVLARTPFAVEVLKARAGDGSDPSKYVVVSNGKDAGQFHPGTEVTRAAARAALGVPSSCPLLVYAGSLGAQYCPAGMLALFRCVAAIRPDARFLVLTRTPGPLMQLLEGEAPGKAQVMLRGVEPAEVPRYLSCADLGIALREVSFSMRGVSPIKLGEYLLCGVPVVATDGIGNTAPIGAAGAGKLLTTHREDELASAARWFLDEVMHDRDGFRERCRSVGLSEFSVGSSVTAYGDALSRLGDRPSVQ